MENKKEGLNKPDAGISSPINLSAMRDLALTDSEHFGTACWTRSLSRRSTVLHGYALGVLHLPLSAALYTISLHLSPPSWLLY